MRNEKSMMLAEALLRKQLTEAKEQIYLLECKISDLEKELSEKISVEKEAANKKKSLKRKSEEEE